MSHDPLKINGGRGAFGGFFDSISFEIAFPGNFEARGPLRFEPLRDPALALATAEEERRPPPPPPAQTFPVDFGPRGSIEPRGEIEPPVAFLDDFFGSVVDVFTGGARQILRSVTPDPIEYAIQVFFPEVGAQVFGSPLGLPAPALPGDIISEAGATPPFFPRLPPGTIGRLEDIFPGTVSSPVIDGRFDIPRPFVPDINDPDFGVVRDEPGIFDDLWRGAIDILPELIPELLGGGVGGAVAGVLAGEVLERTFTDDTYGGVPGFEGIPGAIDTGELMPREMTIEQWAAAGRPSGFCLTTRGTVTRRRRRRRRPLSQQAKDDLAWAKATFGAGKQFDAVVSRMRF